MIDINDPRNPKALGNIKMPGEPTAVSVIGDTSFVAVNTSESYKNRSGKVHAINLKSQKKINRCELWGQPDSTASSPDGSFISIAIVNERDEDLQNGRIPQMPARNLVMISVGDGSLVCGSMNWVNTTGLSIGAEDPEPEFVDINDIGETVLTLQENNHIAVVDQVVKIISHFSAGATDLEKIDALDERGALIFNGSQKNRLREPDGIQWLNNDLFVIDNEGDMRG